MDSRIVALIPVRTGPANGCVVLFESGRRLQLFCSVEKYMNTIAHFMGNDNKACRRLFKGRRGTGVRLNDGSVFVQMKLAKEPPSFGYVLVPAIRGLLPDDQDRCVIYFSHGLTLQTYWKVQTASSHLKMVEKVLTIPEMGEIRVY